MANPTVFKYDEFGNLACEYVKFDAFYKTPDAVGNLYKSRDQDDRKYGKGGKLLQDDKHFYKYDDEGNLILKSTRNITKPLELPKATNLFDRLLGHTEEQKDQIANHQNWQQGDTAYSWLANGMLESVQNPNGELIRFEYDALGRRTAKLTKKEINRYFWDGNVLLHEWNYDLKQRPKLTIDKEGELSYNAKEPINNLVTWVYEEGSFVPTAKLVGEEKYTIINDYIGRPIQVYSFDGNLVWQTDYDIYGNLRNLQGERSFIPFRQLGQYEDVETGLYYNRFRYYDANLGLYISQDPIGLAGNNPNMYAYSFDSNSEVDLFGLSDSSILGGNLGSAPGANYDAHHIVMAGSQDPKMIALRDQMDKFKIGVNDAENGIWLPRKDADRITGDLSTAHKGDGLHGKAYKQDIFDELNLAKTKKEFLEKLSKIKSDLFSGKTFPKCK